MHDQVYLRLVAALAVVALWRMFVVACGGDDSDDIGSIGKQATVQPLPRVAGRQARGALRLRRDFLDPAQTYDMAGYEITYAVGPALLVSQRRPGEASTSRR